MGKKESKSFTRREFIAGTGAAAISFSVMKPEIVFGSNANSKIRIGLIGCGGRGTWITELFLENGNYEIAGAADYFSDKVEPFGDKFNIAGNKRFTGLSAYKRLLETDLDAVVIESPPYFHPKQAAAAVTAGKHVYLAKPIAVDVPGCKSIEDSGKTASVKEICFLIDFQTRADQYYIEAIKRLYEGALGTFAFGEASYHAGNPFENQQTYLDADPTNPENQLRAWGLSRALSGDIITEQNIHTLDVMSWIMNTKPVYAVGTGGHKVRTDKGTCWDHFALLYQYPDNVGITFSSRQFNGHGTTPEGIRNRMFGSEGVLETEYGGNVIIKGNNYYRGGRSPAIYKEGAENNIAAFYKNITEGNYDNITVEPSVTSNLVTILGRTAAYSGRPVYWHQLMKDEERLIPNLKGLID
jgi:myo-inositol 2-dehydrogenase/D-chiro-inositol 1-dehydrogenase